MVKVRGDRAALEEINLAPRNAHEEVAQNIAVILDMVRKSCPMFRDGGIPGEAMGRPLPALENILVGEIYDQIEEYEPRAVIEGVTLEADALTGKVTPVVELKGVREG